MLPPHTSIVDAYNLAGQELLILGEPGAGKSTMLLELARHLIKRAEQDTKQLLPVLLPLSSWANKRPLLQEWLIEQFAQIYQVPLKQSRQWIEANLVLPLFDGLDEMDASTRSACIQEMNKYHREHLGPVVICSRTQEYQTAAAHERLALHTAVVVQPLSREQVETYLLNIGEPLAALRAALQENTALQAVVTTPLLLQILMLTYHGVPVRTLPHLEAQLREQIWTDYVQHMVTRKGNVKRYPLDRTKKQLSWLAQQMRNRNQTIMSLANLDLNWLEGLEYFYCRCVGWFFGVVFGLITAWIFGLLFGFIVGLVFGFTVGLLIGILLGQTGRGDIWMWLGLSLGILLAWPLAQSAVEDEGWFIGIYLGACVGVIGVVAWSVNLGMAFGIFGPDSDYDPLTPHIQA